VEKGQKMTASGDERGADNLLESLATKKKEICRTGQDGGKKKPEVYEKKGAAGVLDSRCRSDNNMWEFQSRRAASW